MEAKKDGKKDPLQIKLEQTRDSLEAIRADEERNLLSLIENNLKIAGRITFVHRIIYIGEHKFASDEPANTLKQLMAANIAAVHSEPCDEMLTGICISYPRHMVHLLEGSEDSLMSHLRRLFAAIDAGESRLHHLKLLLVSHHIKQRFFAYWSAELCKPPVTTEKIDTTASNVVENCMRLCVSNFADLADCCKQQYKISMRPGLPLTDRALVFLPDLQLVEFLLTVNTPAIVDLRSYTEHYGVVPPDSYYSEHVWPAMSDYIPYNPYDVEEEQSEKQDAKPHKKKKKK